MHGRAGGAHVGGIAGAVFHPLQDTNFSRGVVQVIHGTDSVTALLVAANIAEWRHLTARAWWPRTRKTRRGSRARPWCCAWLVTTSREEVIEVHWIK